MYLAEPNRQWIFPSLRFTCTVNVTAWVFTVGATDADVVCPTLELWRDMISPSSTDYMQIQLLTSSSYTQPEALSDSVYRCNLITPLRVSTGTVLGFRTRSQEDNGMSKSNVQLLNTANAPVGYYRNIALAADIFDTAQNNEFTESVPLIAPETDIPSSTDILTPLITSPGSMTTTPLSTPPSIPVLSTPTPTAVIDNQATDNSDTKKSTTPVIVGIVVTMSILLLIAAIVLVPVVILLARHRRQVSSQPSKTTAENGTTVPSTTKTEIKQVRRKNNYTFTSSHIYEPVDGATMSVQEKTQQHDYDFIASVSIDPTGDLENYEIPETTPSRTSSTPDNSVYEVPGTIVDQYDTPMSGPHLLEGGTSVDDCTYDTPIDARGPIQVNVSVGEGGYDTPVDAQVLARGNTEAEESIYETPADAGPGDTESSDVYECV